MTYMPDSTKASLILEMKGISELETDRIPESAAWGMIELAKTNDYTQGRTSETLSAKARATLLADAKEVLRSYGVYYNEGGTPSVGSVKW